MFRYANNYSGSIAIVCDIPGGRPAGFTESHPGDTDRKVAEILLKAVTLREFSSLRHPSRKQEKRRTMTVRQADALRKGDSAICTRPAGGTLGCRRLLCHPREIYLNFTNKSLIR